MDTNVGWAVVAGECMMMEEGISVASNSTWTEESLNFLASGTGEEDREEEVVLACVPRSLLELKTEGAVECSAGVGGCMDESGGVTWDVIKSVALTNSDVGVMETSLEVLEQGMGDSISTSSEC